MAASTMSPTMNPARGETSRHDDPATAQRHKEGAVARGIEYYTAQVPSDCYLWTAGLAVLASLTLHVMGRKEDAQFVGHWVAPVMLLGVYNKIVKVAGSDRVSGE